MFSNRDWVFMCIGLLLGIMVIGVIIYLAIKRRRDKKLQRNQQPSNLNQIDTLSAASPMITNEDDQNIPHITTPILAESSNPNCSEGNAILSEPGNLQNQEGGQPDKTNISPAVKAQLDILTSTSKREIKRSIFEVGDQIGSGNFGKVYKGQLIGLYQTGSKTTVAIKSISGQVSETDLENMVSEIKIMSNVDPHPNLVSMVASCTSEFKDHGKLWLLLEFCQHGDLKDFVKENKTQILSGSDGDVINNRCLIKWAYDVANGMQYLAENQIMHGDLAARNILMDENPLEGGCPIAKVADFGLSKKFNDYLIYEKETRLFVPWRWMALEYLTNNYFTLTSDVWSFGVLFWEMLSFGRTPYGHQGYDELLTKLKTGYRLPCPDEIEHITTWSPKELFNKLSNACFVAEPADRETFSAVVEIIGKELSQEEIMRYTQMRENYKSTRTENYLKLNRSLSAYVNK